MLAGSGQRSEGGYGGRESRPVVGRLMLPSTGHNKHDSAMSNGGQQEAPARMGEGSVLAGSGQRLGVEVIPELVAAGLAVVARPASHSAALRADARLEDLDAVHPG